mgnify:CR=1 FL=1
MPHALTSLVETTNRVAVFSCVCCGHESAIGAPVVRAAGEARPFELHRCMECGVVQQFPRWTAPRITALYDQDYYVFAEREEHRWARAIQQYVIHLAAFESQAAFLDVRRATTASNQGTGPRFLDVGCARGHLAALARRRGWRVTGLDLSADAVSEAAVRFGLDVRAGSLSSHVGTLMPFDVILLGDVIEHVPDPVRFLQDIRKVLAPEGILCIDTPNWGGFWRRWGGAGWLGLNRYHINLFDAESLPGLLGRCGFRDVSVDAYTHYRYQGWITRPEVRRWISWMPGFVGWRIGRFLERRGGGKTWSNLITNPPVDLEGALGRLGEMVKAGPIASQPTAKGDNLIARARR